MGKKTTIRIPLYKLTRAFARFSRMRGYLVKNLGVPFILGFQILLLTCGLLLIQGNTTLANNMAVYAYYLLVLGVVLQLVCFIRYGEDDEEVE